MTGKYCWVQRVYSGKTLIILRFYTKKWQKSIFLMPFSRKAKIFYDFLTCYYVVASNLSLQFTIAA